MILALFFEHRARFALRMPGFPRPLLSVVSGRDAKGLGQ
jgi:hypothetical protein